MTIEITDKARARLSSLLTNNGRPVRLAIESGGCQGFNKVWSVSNGITDDDILMVNGAMVIDSVSKSLLDGAVIDFKTDLSGSYWHITIPTASSTCGCGTSFSL